MIMRRARHRRQSDSESEDSMTENLDQIGKLNLSIPNFNFSSYLNRESFTFSNLPSIDLGNLPSMQSFNEVASFITNYMKSSNENAARPKDQERVIDSFKTAISTRIQMNNFLHDLNLGLSLSAAIERLQPLTDIIHETIFLPADDDSEGEIETDGVNVKGGRSRSNTNGTEPVGVDAIVNRHRPIVNELVIPEDEAFIKASRKKKAKKTSLRSRVFSDHENDSTTIGSDLDVVDGLTIEEVKALTDLGSLKDYSNQNLLRKKIQNIHGLTDLSQKLKNKLITRLMVGNYYKYLNQKIGRSNSKVAPESNNHKIPTGNDGSKENSNESESSVLAETVATTSASMLEAKRNTVFSDGDKQTLIVGQDDQTSHINDLADSHPKNQESIEVDVRSQSQKAGGNDDDDDDDDDDYDDDDDDDHDDDDDDAIQLDGNGALDESIALSEKDLELSFFDHPANTILGCQHYQRNCKIECPTCFQWFPCRFCHDNEIKTHKLIRADVRHVLCLKCFTPQEPHDNFCSYCGFELANYFCSVCKLYDNDPTKEIYHCDKCGICRLGLGLGKDYFHCDKCNICLSIDLKDKHKCLTNTTHCNCPVCNEYLFTSVNKVVFMKCGHLIHQACYDDLSKHSYKCPVCKKTVVNVGAQFRILDQEILQQPLPHPYNLWRCIISCNDCKGKSNVPYHILGLKCKYCRSYNTAQLKLLKPEDEEDEIASEEDQDPDQDDDSRNSRINNPMRLVRTNLHSNFRIDEQSYTQDEEYYADSNVDMSEDEELEEDGNQSMVSFRRLTNTLVGATNSPPLSPKLQPNSNVSYITSIIQSFVNTVTSSSPSEQISIDASQDFRYEDDSVASEVDTIGGL